MLMLQEWDLIFNFPTKIVVRTLPVRNLDLEVYIFIESFLGGSFKNSDLIRPW